LANTDEEDGDGGLAAIGAGERALIAVRCLPDDAMQQRRARRNGFAVMVRICKAAEDRPPIVQLSRKKRRCFPCCAHSWDRPNNR